MTSHPRLARRLTTLDAVVIGLGSMIGAGVFAAFTPAAQAAGSGLLIGLVLAAAVAFCNATASAQLAAEYPTSGGTYVYGRERLGPWPGFLAGWGFVVGKTASCAAMALTFAAYAAPAGWERPVAVAAVVLLTAVNYRGVTRTAVLARIIVAAVLVALAVVVAACWVPGAADPSRLFDGGVLAHGWYGILQSAGLLFFAFAGYARIATMGEEVLNPRKAIPRAIVSALAIAVAVYAAIAISILAVLGADTIARTPAPLAAAVAAGSWDWAVPVVRVGAALAALGALLALIAGLGRTSLAMARGGGPAPVAGRRPSTLQSPAPGRAGGGRGHLRNHRRGRPARRHRIFVLWRPDLLPRGQRRRIHADRVKPPLPQGPAAHRRRRVRSARGHPARGVRGRGAADVRGRRPVPGVAPATGHDAVVLRASCDDGSVTIAKTVLLFVLAAAAEIGGAWLVWQAVREGKDWWWAGLGVLALGLYGFAATLQPDAHFGRILAAYGGVFVAGSLAWGMVFDGFRPDRWDIAGSAICLAGVAVIMFSPRSAG